MGINIEDVRIIQFPKILDDRGNLSFIEEGNHIPFEIKRIYWIYDVPGGEVRGGHAYYALDEVIIALSGSFDVVVRDGGSKEKLFSLNQSFYGLMVPKMIWRQLINFSTNSTALILASTSYNEDDYIRDYSDYIKASQNA